MGASDLQPSVGARAHMGKEWEGCWGRLGCCGGCPCEGAQPALMSSNIRGAPYDLVLTTLPT